MPTTCATALDIARDLGAPLLSRGAGTSQCGQTTGAALVVDVSKHLRQVLAVDREAMTAEVEPGIVLDALNAHLKPLGLWFPVDVSTSAQATIGGMAGNNSCGSRSIAYGNMVHNVLGIDAWLSDGSSVVVRTGRRAGREGARDRRLRARPRRRAARDEIEARWPKVLRRVGGYNLDIFQPQSERPYTADGSVNLAHLLVGAEGTLAVYRSLKLKLAPLPRSKVLGVVNFPTFRAAMAAAQHLVTLGPDGRRAGRPDDDRAGPRQPGVPADDGGSADRRAGGDPAGRVQRRRPRRRCCAACRRWCEMVGDLGLPGSRRRDARRGAAEGACGRCARPASTS